MFEQGARTSIAQIESVLLRQQALTPHQRVLLSAPLVPGFTPVPTKYCTINSICYGSSSENKQGLEFELDECSHNDEMACVLLGTAVPWNNHVTHTSIL